jgi:hypothetical protein
VAACLVIAFSGVAAQSGRDSSADVGMPQSGKRVAAADMRASADSTAAVSERDGRRALQYRDGLRELGLSVNDPAKRASLSRSETCRNARRAVHWYREVVREYAAKMGAGTSLAEGRTEANAACPRYLVKVLRSKARAMRLRWERWWHWHFAWWDWLPANWRALGACETGYGKQPGNWTWDSGAYVSAFGIYRAGYADDAHRIGNLSWDETISRLHRFPTPREQYEAGLSHYRTWGDGWGCAGP